jgi:hypothetical protein
MCGGRTLAISRRTKAGSPHALLAKLENAIHRGHAASSIDARSLNAPYSDPNHE